MSQSDSSFLRGRIQRRLLRRGGETRRNLAFHLTFDRRRLSFRSDFSIPSFSAALIPYLSRARTRVHTRAHFLPTETLLSWDLPEVEARSSTPQSKCLCQTSGCLCCIDLNLTSTIDLGGPACVNIKQKEQNISLNLSYGDNPIHNATIKIGK